MGCQPPKNKKCKWTVGGVSCGGCVNDSNRAQGAGQDSHRGQGGQGTGQGGQGDTATATGTGQAPQRTGGRVSTSEKNETGHRGQGFHFVPPSAHGKRRSCFISQLHLQIHLPSNSGQTLHETGRQALKFLNVQKNSPNTPDFANVSAQKRQI